MSDSNKPTPAQIAALPQPLRDQVQRGGYTPPPAAPKPTFATTALPRLGMAAPIVLVVLGVILGLVGLHFGWW